MAIHMPKRSRASLVSEVEGESIVLNHETREIHCLDNAARFIFEHCDGETSIAEIALQLRQTLGVGEEYLWSALGGFDEKGLLAEPWVLPETTRRRFIRKYGTAAALAPLAITSMLAPAPAEAASRRKKKVSAKKVPVKKVPVKRAPLKPRPARP